MRPRPRWRRTTYVARLEGWYTPPMEGSPEVTQFEAFIYTFGKGKKDQARTFALRQVAEAWARGYAEYKGYIGFRVDTRAAEVFEVVDPSESVGLGAYKVAIRIDDKDVSKTDVRYRRSVGDVAGAVLSSLESMLWGFLY